MMVSFLTIFGISGLVFGGLGYMTLPMGLKYGVGQSINLKQDGMVFPIFMDPPFPSRSKFYIYEIKNPRDVLTGKKMELNLRGPYFYHAFIRRDNISFAKSGESVKYDTRRELHLDEEASENLDERFWMLNPILPSLQSSVKVMVLDKIPFARLSEPIVFNSVNVLLDNFKERLIVKRSPRELLEGKKVEMLETLTGLASRFGLESLIPPGPPGNIFGIAHAQNVTIDAFEVWTGVGSTKHRFAEVIKWRGKDRLTFWDGKCNIIDGTNGELYKPFLRKGQPIRIFLGMLCRAFDLDPVGEATIQNGFETYEYEVTQRLFQGVRNQPSNRCYCKDPRTYDCQYDGLMSMGPCFFDAPVYFTRSNFRGTNRRIRSLINESSLEYELPDKQSFYLDPVTGTVLKVNVSFTITFKMVRQPYLRDMANIRNLTYAPLIVANEGTAQTIEVPLSLTWQLMVLQLVMKYYQPFYMIMALSGFIMLLMRFRQTRKTTPAQVNPNR